MHNEAYIMDSDYDLVISSSEVGTTSIMGMVYEESTVNSITISDGTNSVDVDVSNIVIDGGMFTINDIDVSSLSDGELISTIKYTDTAGNTQTVTSDIKKDTTTEITSDVANDSDSGISNTDNITSDNTLTINGEGEVGANIVITDENGAEVGVATITEDGKYSITTNQLDDGTHTLTVTSTDPAGNSATSIQEVKIDTSILAPTINLADASDAGSSNSDNITNDNTPTIDGTGEVGATVVITDENGVEVGTGVVDDDGTYSIEISQLDDGAHTLTSTITDKAGNSATSTQDLTVDTTISVTSDLVESSDSGSSNSDNITNDNTPTIDGTGEVGATVVITDENGVEVGTSVVGEDGKYSITTSQLDDGTHTLTSTITDTAGNSATSAQEVKIDTATTNRVELEDLDGTENFNFNNDGVLNNTELNTSVFAGEVEPGSTIDSITITDGTNTINVDVSNVTIDDEGKFEISGTNLGSLSDGALTLEITSTDVAGNQKVTTNEGSVTKNTMAEVTTDLADESDSGESNTDNITNDTTVTLTGVGDVDALVIVKDEHGNELRGEDDEDVYIDEDGKYSFTTTALSEGTHNLTVTIIDDLGNEATATQTVTIDTTADAGTVTIDAITADDTINSAESQTDMIEITGKAEGGDVSVGDSVTMTINNQFYSTTVNEDGTWSVEVAGSDLAADTSFDVNVTSVDIAGNTVTSTSTSTHTVDTGIEVSASDVSDSIREDVARDGNIGTGAHSHNAGIENTVLATFDAHGDTVTYNLSGDDASKFEVVNNQLRVKTGATFDYETNSDALDVKVSMTDVAGNTTEQDFAFNIADYEGSYEGSKLNIRGTSEEDNISLVRAHGNKIINSDSGDDVISIDGGSAIKVFSGAGDDVVSVDGSEKSYIVARDGDDNITVKNISNYTEIKAGNGDNVISVDSIGRNSKITTNSGDNTIEVKNVTGKSIIETKDGDDNITVKNTIISSKINAGDGDNVVSVDGSKESNVVSGTGDDNITVKNITRLDSSINAGNGDNVISVDSIARNSKITTNSGDNTIEVKNVTGKSTIETKDGDDNITVKNTRTSSEIKAGNGDNVVSVDGSKESNVVSGTGDDNITVKNITRLDSSINAGNGDNVISVDGIARDSKITTNSGDNTIEVKNVTRRSFINTKDGDDNIDTENAFSTVINARKGDNTINIKNSTNYTKVNALDGDDVVNIDGTKVANVNVGGGDNIVEIKNLHGVARNVNNVVTKSGDDYVSLGSSENSTLVSSKIYTGSGDDTVVIDSNTSTNIKLQDGDDIAFLSGKDGSRMGKEVHGGDGYDTVIMDTNYIHDTKDTHQFGDRHVFKAKATNRDTRIFDDVEKVIFNDRVFTDDANGRLKFVANMAEQGEENGEHIVKSSGDDTINTGDQNDFVSAGAGNDTINTGAGDDNIVAGSGNDTVDAGAGNDKVFAGDGDDIIKTGSGDDYVDGGAGDDTIVLGEGDFVLDGGTGNDTLMLDGDMNLDFDLLSSNDNSIANMETIDLSEGSHELTNLDINDVLQIAGGDRGEVDLTILGDSDDSVSLKNTTEGGEAQNWEAGDTVIVDGNEFVTYTNNDVSMLIDSDVNVTFTNG